jgi:hypothetical protein
MACTLTGGRTGAGQVITDDVGRRSAVRAHTSTNRTGMEIAIGFRKWNEVINQRRRRGVHLSSLSSDLVMGAQCARFDPAGQCSLLFLRDSWRACTRRCMHACMAEWAAAVVGRGAVGPAA